MIILNVCKDNHIPLNSNIRVIAGICERKMNNRAERIEIVPKSHKIIQKKVQYLQIGTRGQT